MHRCRHLLVALPRTEADAGLITYAALLARLGAAVEVRFVHVLPVGDEAARKRDRILAEMEEEVREAFADVSETVQPYCNVLKGPLLDRLLEFAAEQQVDLIIVGHQPSRSGRRSLARRLAMKAPCSVWMVPDGSPPSIRRILVPVDFS
jgi:sulfate permease, SulP family